MTCAFQQYTYIRTVLSNEGQNGGDKASIVHNCTHIVCLQSCRKEGEGEGGEGAREGRGELR